MKINPYYIRFSQMQPFTQQYSKTFMMLNSRGDIVLDVVLMPDGQLTVIDNQLLFDARNVDNVKVNAEIHLFSEKIESKHKYIYKTTCVTWGPLILNIIKSNYCSASNSCEYRKANPYGWYSL